jgi:ribosomal protein S1
MIGLGRSRRKIVELNINDVVEVKITDVNDDGLGVEIGDYKGFVRIVDLDWNTVGLIDRIYRDFNLLDTVTVKIMAVQGQRFWASIRELFPEKNPWSNPEIYSLGANFSGEIKQVTSFGYFVELDTGAQALLKKSPGRGGEYRVGQYLDLVVSEVDPSLHKIIVVQSKGVAL